MWAAHHRQVGGRGLYLFLQSFCIAQVPPVGRERRVFKFKQHSRIAAYSDTTLVLAGFKSTPFRRPATWKGKANFHTTNAGAMHKTMITHGGDRVVGFCEHQICLLRQLSATLLSLTSTTPSCILMPILIGQTLCSLHH